MTHHCERWTDEQVLAVLRADYAAVPAVAASFGMSPNVAYKYRLSGSKRGARLRREHAIAGPWKFSSTPSVSPMGAERAMIRAAIRGEHVE
jgi:hypothetical protein